MKWMRAIQCGLLCGVFGWWIGFFIGVEYNSWYRVVSEKGAGYVYFKGGEWGLAVGLVVGVATALLTAGGFWRQLGISMAVLVAVAWTSWAVAGWESPPKLEGEELNLLVEVRSPAGWKPSNQTLAGQNQITLETLNGAESQTSLRVRDVVWPFARWEEGRWIVPGEVEVYLANARRQVRMKLGGEEIVFRPGLPARPGPEAVQWGAWTAAGSPAGYEYRMRVERVGDTVKRSTERREARMDSLRKRFAALGPAAPLTAYLDFYKNDLLREFELNFTDELLRKIQGRAEELGPLLASPAYSRRALALAVRMKGPVPESYEQPLRRALPLMVKAIDEYRQGDPRDPDFVL